MRYHNYFIYINVFFFSLQACPLNPAPHILDNAGSHYMEDFSERFAPAIKGVVEFAKRIPGFGFLSQDDQVTLLKVNIFSKK